MNVIPGSDMTPEAALTKLSYVLSKSEWSIQTKRTVSCYMYLYVCMCYMYIYMYVCNIIVK